MPSAWPTPHRRMGDEEQHMQPDENRKLAQREQLFPLIKELARRVSFRGLRFIDLAEATGLPQYQVKRILGAETGAPNWLEMNRLLVTIGMTPNEAAELVGLYSEVDNNPLHLGMYDRELLALINDPALSETDREDIVRAFITFLNLEKEVRLRRREFLAEQPEEAVAGRARR